MSYNASDHVSDHDDVVCACGVAFDYTTTLAVCEHPGCETTICLDCRQLCECCPGRFCSAHVSETTDGVKACPKCEARDMDADELLACEGIDLLAKYVNPSAAFLARAIIREAQL